MSSSEAEPETAGATAPAGPVGAAATPAIDYSPPRRPSRLRWAIATLVVVAVVVLGYVAVEGFGPGVSPHAGNGSSYSAAEVLANKSANGVPGGPWELVTALGYAPAAFAQATANSSIVAGCTVSSAGEGLTTSVDLPAFVGSFSSGVAPWWGMFYYQPTTEQLLVVEVVNGLATALLIASGTCIASFQKLTPIPSDAEDSPTAALAAWDQEGSTFVSAHSNLTLNLELALIGGGSYQGTPIGPSWLIEYSPCLPLALGGPTGSQPTFEAIVDALTGTVAPVVTSTTC
jgi:hypothetical protein